MYGPKRSRRDLRSGGRNTQNDPDNHDGVITHLEPDILECEIKWALGSITMNKTSGSDGIPFKFKFSYFKY